MQDLQDYVSSCRRGFLFVQKTKSTNKGQGEITQQSVHWGQSSIPWTKAPLDVFLEVPSIAGGLSSPWLYSN